MTILERQRPHPLTPDAVAKLRTVSTATLTTQVAKHGIRSTFLTGITPLRPDLSMVGYAFTLRYVPAREDQTGMQYDNTKNVQRIAVESVGPEDVLIIDARSDTRAATFGNILATRMMVRGAAGIVTDGAVRDTPAFRAIDLPVYARAAHATASFAVHHPVDINVPIGCAGVLVIPGDVIVGDAEGVIVIPAQIAEEVAHAAYEQERLEEFVVQKITAGASILGVYPPDEQTQAEYIAWRASHASSRS